MGKKWYAVTHISPIQKLSCSSSGLTAPAAGGCGRRLAWRADGRVAPAAAPEGRLPRSGSPRGSAGAGLLSL